ncbi:MAG: NusG domain II-containing protein [Clostridia bacterium]|nr:NusG domain II-containing protein [Clostridia bacterium]
MSWICVIICGMMNFMLPALAAESQDSIPAEGADAPRPARGYVLVTTATRQGFLPLPEEEDYVFPLTETLSDGTVWENVIHLTPEGVYMESANCENHDCVDEGTVTLENRKDRILGNMIVCLPHQVTLELYTPEEILKLLADAQARDEFLAQDDGAAQDREKSE